ncbi:protein DEFECTIVE IN MERISTEM SILENCING 3 [Ricinus communis]|uniref:protein DEFECTIVE IN MERISTEM SILENCING 3 n=1 Tax=Ricinus communis TaxID=3988 RepID=UPI00201A6208|nr:protein DEFECTIVE IN MERISTEM SILENCING 3 [Ricinus communis]
MIVLQEITDEAERLRKDKKRHEDNLKFLQSEASRLDKSILDLQVILGKYRSTNALKAVTTKNGAFHSEEETADEILKQEITAAAIVYQLKTRHAVQASSLPLTKDVLGKVATLASVDGDNLNWFLSEYLGLETMLAIVCRTVEGVKLLEKYDEEGKVNSSTGLHGLAASMGRKINGRFLVICLEDLRPSASGFIADDPHKKLDLIKPKLPNGMCPTGFLDFEMNMTNLDRENSICLTANGYGLRETLFYTLFSESLDGGIIKRNGVFALGNVSPKLSSC